MASLDLTMGTVWGSEFPPYTHRRTLPSKGTRKLAGHLCGRYICLSLVEQLALDPSKTECQLHSFILLPIVVSLATARMEAVEAQVEVASGDSVGGLGTASYHMCVRDPLEDPELSFYRERRQVQK